MPHTFIQIGTYWLNLDLVAGVELLADPSNASKIGGARVHFTGGKEKDFWTADEVKTLADWLKAHKG